MRVTPILDAQPYDAPRHFGVRGYRLQGGEVSPFGTQVGLSVFEPGGGAELSSSGVDRVYVVVSGAITIAVAGTETLLRECDSCFIPAGEARAIRNHGLLPCVMITVIPRA